MRGGSVQERSHAGCCAGSGRRPAVDFLRFRRDNPGSNISRLQRGIPVRFLVMSSLQVFVLAAGIVSMPAVAATIDYNRDIRPILSENCFSCHGFDEKARKAKLRLDLAESANTERDGVTPFKPGDPKNSEAWTRIISEDAEEQMPPAKSHLNLTGAEKAKIKAWIEQGAKYAGHWSFIPPASARPVPRNGLNPIDVLIQQRLAGGGIETVAGSGSPDAHPPGVARSHRPPAPGARSARRSCKDSDPQAYEALVDRLLDSPHFGERLALDWLDAARYADTNGFSIDGGRHMWLWRDWVIQAFNDNKPYDRFLIEQLAGDLLPDRTEAS